MYAYPAAPMLASGHKLSGLQVRPETFLPEHNSSFQRGAETPARLRAAPHLRLVRLLAGGGGGLRGAVRGVAGGGFDALAHVGGGALGGGPASGGWGQAGAAARSGQCMCSRAACAVQNAMDTALRIPARAHVRSAAVCSRLSLASAARAAAAAADSPSDAPGGAAQGGRQPGVSKP